MSGLPRRVGGHLPAQGPSTTSTAPVKGANRCVPQHNYGKGVPMGVGAKKSCGPLERNPRRTHIKDCRRSFVGKNLWHRLASLGCDSSKGRLACGECPLVDQPGGLHGSQQRRSAHGSVCTDSNGPRLRELCTSALASEPLACAPELSWHERWPRFLWISSSILLAQCLETLPITCHWAERRHLRHGEVGSQAFGSTAACSVLPSTLHVFLCQPAGGWSRPRRGNSGTPFGLAMRWQCEPVRENGSRTSISSLVEFRAEHAAWHASECTAYTSCSSSTMRPQPRWLPVQGVALLCWPRNST